MLKKIALGIGALITLAGCQVNTVTIDPSFEMSRKSLKMLDEKTREQGFCPVHLAEFVDARKSKSLGFVFVSIVETDVESWVDSALQHYNIKNSNDPKSGSIKLELVKAYIQSLRSSMAANVVLSAQYKSPDDNEFSNKKFFRGYEVDVNWNSGQSEILSTLNKALADSLLKISEHIKVECEV